MAENKKSFILYADLIHVVKKLVEQDRINKTNYAGELFLQILGYVNDQNPVPIDFIVDMAFEPIKQQLKRDLRKYESKQHQWSEAGKASAEAKRLAKEKNVEKRSTDSTDVEKRSTDSTVNGTVSVNGTVNVIESVSTGDLNLIHAHTSIFQKTIENDLWLDEMAMTLLTDPNTVKKFTTQKFKEWKIAGTLTKYTLGTLIGWLIKDFKQDNGRKTIKDFEKVEMEKKNKNVPVGTHDKLYGG